MWLGQWMEAAMPMAGAGEGLMVRALRWLLSAGGCPHRDVWRSDSCNMALSLGIPIPGEAGGGEPTQAPTVAKGRLISLVSTEEKTHLQAFCRENLQR